jgi:NADH:ubiquinone oxidoreductase subunit
VKQSWLSKFFTVLSCKRVGRDSFGNEYYESLEINKAFGRKSRRVVYHGIAEASKVPSVWNAWLTFQCDDAPKRESVGYRWERAHEPNLSGTKYAYYPPGHIKGGADRKRATGDYEAWNPTVEQRGEL